MKRFALTICLLFPFAVLTAETPEAMIVKGNKAYSQGHYEDAIALYGEVIRMGYESENLFYNLGNAYFKNNELPPAILYYEKALKIDPNDADTRYNLAVANSRIADKIEKIPELFYKRWWTNLKNLFSLDTLSVLIILFVITGLVLAGIYLVSRRMILRRVSFWSAAALLALAFVMLGIASQKNSQLKARKEGIVFTPTVTVKSSPDPSSIDLFVLHEGSKVLVQDSIGGWIEVKIANGSQGWILATDIRKI
ncbi:MAG TPA: tetratricopeptide repeat protein [Bacteroidales bacterium]|nr:tetratricopeptide repeat protein [Bacteroidales bacterium]HPT03258.1 tetratricopeptide repeat protein [Bacteroidales bacterium]